MGSNCSLQPQRAVIHQSRGFTLVELVVVMAIMGVLLGIALPSFSAWRESTAGKAAADSLLAHLKQARIMAVAESRSVKVAFDNANGRYTLDKDGPKERVIDLADYSKNLSLNASLSSITFSSTGTAQAANIAITNANGKTWTISVNIIGRAKLT